MSDAMITFLGGVLTGLLVTFITHRLALRQLRQQREWQERDQKQRETWEEKQRLGQRAWEDAQRKQAEDFQYRLDQQGRAWQAQLERQKQEWDQEKKEREEFRRNLRVSGSSVVNEIQNWQNVQHVIRAAESFGRYAGLDDAGVLKLLELEPVLLNIDLLQQNVRSHTQIDISTEDLEIKLAEMGFKQEGGHWVLSEPPKWKDFDVSTFCSPGVGVSFSYGHKLRYD